MLHVFGFCYRNIPLVSTNFLSVIVAAKWSIAKLSGLKPSFVSLTTHDSCVGKSGLSSGQRFTGLGWAQSCIYGLWQLEKRPDFRCWLATERLTRRQGHMSLIIKLASLGLLTWQWRQHLQDQTERSNPNVHALLKSPSCHIYCRHIV